MTTGFKAGFQDCCSLPPFIPAVHSRRSFPPFIPAVHSRRSFPPFRG